MRQNHKILASASSTIKVSDSSVGNGVNRKVLIIGDSTTANGIAVTKLNENFNTDVMDITLIGTQGTAPNNHEGRSGRRIDQYFSDPSSPFVFNGSFDFAQYMTTNGYSNLDYVFINLGINDVFQYKNDDSVSAKITTMLSQYQSVIDSIHSYDSNIKIGISITIPPAYSQDPFGKAYGNLYDRDRYKRNNFLLCEALIDKFDYRENENIYLVPINTNLDTRYNMGLEDIQVNARNSMTIKSTVANGNVHPAESGYWQIADVYWYFLKSFEN